VCGAVTGSIILRPFVSASGSLVNVSLTISPIKGGEGKVVGVVKIARDITQRKRTEAQIVILAREAEHRAKNLLANVRRWCVCRDLIRPTASEKQSRDASRRWQMSIRCSSSPARREPS
jgi:hypothetical protein